MDISDKEFNNFRLDNIALNKVIFALNNIPDIVHKLLFKENSEVCKQYFSITLKLENSKINNIYHNLNDIEQYFNDDKLRYCFIRLNIITNTFHKMHHINCIIIDKINKTILFFEPRVTFLFDINDLINNLHTLININGYITLLPSDIGYNFLNKLQKYDMFCQTYTLFVYLLIINNNVNHKDYSIMFNTTITSQTICYLFYHIHKLLQQNNCQICDQPIIWKYPTNIIENMINIITLPSNNNINETNEVEMSSINIYEEDDMIIVNIEDD